MKPQRYTFLFVDDEPWLSDALRVVLEAQGHECCVVNNATAAWDVLESKYIDVLVTDIMMPGGDRFSGIDSQEMGFGLINSVLEKWPDQPIICLSVIGDIEKINDLKRKKVLYLRKGETPLNTTIKLILSKASGTIFSS